MTDWDVNGLTTGEREAVVRAIEDARVQGGMSQKAAHAKALEITGISGEGYASNWAGVVGGYRNVSLAQLRAMAEAVGLELRITTGYKKGPR